MKHALAFGVAVASLLTAGAGEPVRSDGVPSPDVPLRRFGDDRFRVTGEVRGSAVAADGKRLAVLSVCEPRRHAIVTIFDGQSGRPLVISRVPYDGWETFPVAGINFSPDGRRLAVVVNKRTAFAIATVTGREVWRAAGQRHAYPLAAFDPAGRLIRTFRKEARVTDLATGQVVATWPVGGVVKLTPDAKTYVKFTGKYSEFEPDEHGSLEVGDTVTGRVRHALNVRTELHGSTDGFAISHDGTTVAVVHDRKELHLIDLATGQTRRTWPLAERHLEVEVYAVSFSRDDGTVLLKACRRPISRWEAATGKELPPLVPYDLSEFRNHSTSSEWRGVGTAPDGKTVFAVNKWGHVERWDAATGRALAPDANLISLRFALSPDGKQLVTGDETGRVLVLDATSGRAVRRLRDREPNFNLRDLATSPDGQHIASVTATGRVDVFPSAGGPVVNFRPAGDNNYPRGLLWAGDGKSLFVRGFEESELYDVATRQGFDWTGQSHSGRFLARSPDGSSFIVVESPRGAPEQLVKWDIKGKKLTRPWLKTNPLDLLEEKYPEVVAVGSDPAVVAIAEADKVVLTGITDRLFGATDDLPEFRQSMRFGDLYTWPVVECLAFTPDAKWLISGGGDCAVKVWEVATARLVRRFDGHDDRVTQIAVSPDGRFAFSSDGAFVSQWDLTPRSSHLKPSAEALWAAAASADPAVGVPAAWKLLSDAGLRAFVVKQLPPATKPDGQKVSTWIGRLDAAAFADRAAATKELAALGRAVEPALRAALQETPGAEVRQRLENLIGRFDKAYSPEELRAMRLVQAAEWFRQREPLTAWAAGAEHAALTRDARVALARLNSHPSTP